MKNGSFVTNFASARVVSALAPVGGKAHNFAVSGIFGEESSDRRLTGTTRGAGERVELRFSVA